jgi:hypothetical protein
VPSTASPSTTDETRRDRTSIAAVHSTKYFYFLHPNATGPRTANEPVQFIAAQLAPMHGPSQAIRATFRAARPQIEGE